MKLSLTLSLTLSVLVTAVTLYCLLFVINLFLADVSFNFGERAGRYGFYETAAEYYRGAINLNPREPRYHRELASVLATLAQGVESSEERVALMKEAATEAKTAYRLNPKNSLTVRSLISTYAKMGEVDAKYLARAQQLAQEVIDQQPTNPQLYYQQALVFLQGERNKEAIASLKKALELKPDYQKARELLQFFQ